MPGIQFEDQEKAKRAFDANLSPRYRRLESLECWYNGTQYDGLANWWDGGEGDNPVPLWERQPCIVYPVVKIAVQSNVDLVLGEGRFPSFTTKPGESEAAEDNGLSEDDSKVIDRFMVEYHRLCAFRSHCRSAFESAQSCGSVGAIHGVRNGRPHADLVPAKWGTPTFGVNGEVVELEIKYPFIEEYKKANGQWAMRAKIYRRVINAQSDTTYKPADAQLTGIDPQWVADPQRSVDHNLGFCPVVWYAFMKGCVPVSVIDGHAIHEDVLDEIRQHDIAVSQRHRCALLSEPQICEIGVEEGYNPTATGRIASVPATERGGMLKPGEQAKAHYIAGKPSMGARKKGPGYVWQYSGAKDQVDVKVLSMPADALKTQFDNASDIRIKLQEALCVVFLDPENIKFAATTSGKALEAIKQKQIDRCDQYRDDLRDNFLLPSIDMQLRIAQRIGTGMRVPGIVKALPILAKFAKPEPVKAVESQNAA